jgi:5-oxopent-3-ene-1,2,5-tricarboxylate decarboxylase/2-hydroxyhepta-2,4-diene-1,7-dioate isomerase
MIGGTIYGVALNDANELSALASAFAEAPYAAPPKAPIVYIKPRSAMVPAGAVVAARAPLKLGATVGLLFARDASHIAEADALAHVGACCLALDLGLAGGDYYRPAIARNGSDGFLPVGNFAPLVPLDGAIDIRGDGEMLHSWSLDRLARPAARLIADLSRFMTLKAGDLLLLGTAGDAPIANTGVRLEVRGLGLPSLSASIGENRP